MNSKKRSIGVFILASAVLLFLVVVGVKLIKNRDIAVAHNTSQAPVSQPSESTPKPQEQGTVASPPSPQTSPTPVAAPPSNPSSAPSPSVANQAPTHVPETGPSYVDFAITGLLMMAATYFIVMLKRARHTLKRMVLGY